MAAPVIITCAITGSIHTPTMSPYLPITLDQIVAEAIDAAEAGAAIIHLHARDPKTGLPSGDPALFMDFLPRIKAHTSAVLNVSTGGSSRMTLEQRLAPAKAAKPEMCSLNMGSMNFGLFPMQDHHTVWQHEWEPAFLEATKDVIFKNTFSDIEGIIESIGEQDGALFEFEIYDIGHLQTLAFYIKKGIVKQPVFLQFVLGVLGGIDASAESLMNLKTTADRLIGDFHFSVLAAGGKQFSLGTMGIILGGNVRVGLEDSLTIARGELAKSNADQVRKIRRMIEELGHTIATPNEARRRLGLKGIEHVAY
jgi:uncharacterized protein (DUF849 family)